MSIKRRFAPKSVAAEFSGMSEKTIERMQATGELTAYRPRRGKILVDLNQLEKVILASAGKTSSRGRKDDNRLPAGALDADGNPVGGTFAAKPPVEEEEETEEEQDIKDAENFLALLQLQSMEEPKV